jgi:filamentous hemagglutinin family protein
MRFDPPLRWLLRRLPALLLGCLLVLSGLHSISHAQVPTTLTPDGTLGTTVTPTGTVHTIAGGTITGGNQFHSFARFDVGRGDTARFTGPIGIANILSRVTGGQQSVIDGTLHSEIPGANLYLFNPSGVLFGRNARLNVSGSFHVSTADVLRLADGAPFYADLAQVSRLTVAAPAAFGFLGPAPEPITVQGSRLAVPADATLALIGGNIQIQGQGTELRAPSGQLTLVSVGSAGDVALHAPRAVEHFARLGQITVAQATLDAGDSRSPGGGGGTVVIRGGRFEMKNSARLDVDVRHTGESAETGIDIAVEELVVTQGSDLQARVMGAADAGAIQITARRVSLEGASEIDGRALSGTGAPASITITVQQLTLQDGASITASSALSEGPGGGSVTITATDGVTLSGDAPGGGSGIFSTAARGRGGEIRLSVGTLTLEDGGQISTSARGEGAGGAVTITATEAVTLRGSGPHLGFASGIRSRTFGTGAAGQVTLSAPRVRLEEGGTITTESQGDGPAGSLTIRAGRLTLTSGAQLSSSTAGGSPGGRVDVLATETVTLAERGTITTASAGDGRGGDIEVRADRVTLTGGAQITSASAGGGPGGTVQVTAATVGLEEGGTITTASEGDGAAGSLTVRAGRVTLLGGARLDSSTRGGGSGGTVTVTATDAMTVSGPDSGVFTETMGQGPGGDIVLRTRAVQLTDGATVSAQSAGTGNAGNVHIQAAESLLVRSGSTVTTAAPEADGGDISVTAENGTVRLTDSHISAEVNQEEGQGGSVTITAGSVILERSQVLTRAGPGTGGDITIDGAFVFDGTFVSGQPCAANPATSCLDASGRVSGRIDEGSPVDTSGITSPLPHGFTQATALLRQRCAARRRGGEHNSFVLAGRDGIPLEPGSMLPSPLAPVEKPAGARNAGGKEYGAVLRAGILMLGDDGGPPGGAQAFSQKGGGWLDMRSKCR